MSIAENDGRRLRGLRSRSKILEHAILIASAEGLDGLTIGRVATEAGVGKGNITVLFGDREKLQLAILDHAMELFRQMVIEPAEQQRDPLARIRSWIESWFSFVERRVLPGGCFLNAVSSEYRTRDGVIRDKITEYRTLGRQRLRNWIEEAKLARKIADDVDVEALVFELMSYQAIANVAALMGEQELFERARKASQSIVADAAAVAVKPIRRPPLRIRKQPRRLHRPPSR
ncbi:TetR/AcrR family transcriptional regulator [Telmatospirillum siberiense]|uniref:TetR/AcrR family transcriptional regulator n=1 Tax=Telmatospirillum siberiense TaxID=382514 RepID=UPI0018EAC9C7|nr:TetR/AcrR family transcriptional regulator [Telmatospirillum siberiense]